MDPPTRSRVGPGGRCRYGCYNRASPHPHPIPVQDSGSPVIASPIHLHLALGVFAVLVAVFIAAYLLARSRWRREAGEIQRKAGEQGWAYDDKGWAGRPTAFRLGGQTAGGLPWILDSLPLVTSRGDGWAHTVLLHVPSLGGEVDWAVLPRQRPMNLLTGIAQRGRPAGMAALALFSALAASVNRFFREAHEVPSGLEAFDKAYRVLVRVPRPGRPAVGGQLAEAFVLWPAGAMAPHSVSVWRDFLGLHLQARLFSPPTRDRMVARMLQA